MMTNQTKRIGRKKRGRIPFRGFRPLSLVFLLTGSLFLAGWAETRGIESREIKTRRAETRGFKTPGTETRGADNLGTEASFWSDFILPTEAAAGRMDDSSRGLIGQTEVSQTADSLSFSKDVIIRGIDFPSCRSFQIWGDYYLGSGEINPKDSPYLIDNDLNGAQIGLNIGLGSAFLATGYYNYNRSEITYDGKSNEDKTHLGGVGLRYNAGGFYFTLLGNYGIDSYELSAEDGRQLDYDGWQAGGSFETGYTMSTGGLFTLKPFGNLQYSHLACDGFDRKRFTAGGDDLKYDALFQTLGARIDVDLSLLTLQGRMAWVHQYLTAAPINNYWFGRNPGTYTPTQLFYEGTAGRDYFWGGLGLKLSLFGMMAATLDYDVLVNSYQTTHLGSAGLLWSF